MMVFDRSALDRPLRDNPELFKSVHLTADGAAIAWNDEIDMAATTIKRLAERRHYVLEELLADFDPDAHQAEMESWDRMPSVGREVI
jgi:hypothetical protein